MPEPHQPNDLSDFSRARAEACELLGLDIEHLSAADALKVDLCVVLRRAIDLQTESAFDGAQIDLPRLMAAIERLTSLLPPAEQANRADPRAALLELITTMRERERAVGAITPSEADVVPPSEQADRHFFCGPPKPGPDDPKPPVTIEGEVTKPKGKASRSSAPPAPADDAVDLRRGFDDTPEPWRRFSHLYE